MKRQSRWLRIVPGVLLVIGMLSAQSAQLAFALPGTATTGPFALDGFACQQSANAPDWSNLNTGNFPGQGNCPANKTGMVTPVVDDFIDDRPTIDTSYFTTGASKIGSNMSGWLSGGSSPNKAEIEHAYATVLTDPTTSHQITYFGQDRAANNGSTDLGYWFFRHTVNCCNASHQFTDGAGHRVIHSDGDVLILSDFTQGGTVDTVQIYEWRCTTGATPTGGACGTSTATTASETGSLQGPLNNTSLPADCKQMTAAQFTTAQVCMTVNSGTMTVPWSTSTTPSGQLGANEFQEGGLDLTQFIGNSGCVSSYMAETDSSFSLSSSVGKDFALGTLSTCKPPTITTSGSTTSGGNTTGIPSVNGGYAAKVPINASITDTALVSGNTGLPAPTGTVTFNLYKDDPTCGSNGASTTNRVFTNSQSVSTVSGTNNASATSTNYTASSFGTYYWQDTYNPGSDPNYLPVTETCGQETVQVVDARILLSPAQAANEIGTPHTLTATVQSTTDGTNWSPVDAAAVTGSKTSDTSGSAQLTGSPCTTASSGAAEGTCTFTLTDTAPGKVTVSATATNFSVTGVTGTFTRSTDSTGSNSGPATKYFVDGTISITPQNAINETGHSHAVGILFKVNDGSGSGLVNYNGASATITLTSDGCGANPAGPFTGQTANAVQAGSGAAAQNGVFNATFNCSSVGSITAQGSATAQVTPTGCTNPALPAAQICTVTLTRTTGDGKSGDSSSANKVYADANIKISPLTATNLQGNVETYTITVQQATSKTGSTPNWSSAPDGTPVKVTLAQSGGNPFPSDAAVYATAPAAGSCPSAAVLTLGDLTSTSALKTSGGTVTVYVLSCQTGKIDVNAQTSVTVADPNDATKTVTISRATGDGLSVDSSDAVKTYIAPFTVLSVADTLKGLDASMNGTVSYVAYTSGTACTADTTGANGAAEGSSAVSGGVAPSSTSVSIGPGTSWGDFPIFFRAIFTGTGANNSPQHFVTGCNESATTSSP